MLFRQTNAVWVAFILGAAVVRWTADNFDGGRREAGDRVKFVRLPVERQVLHVLRYAWQVRGR